VHLVVEVDAAADLDLADDEDVDEPLRFSVLVLSGVSSFS